jgi:hypothetical protein
MATDDVLLTWPDTQVAHIKAFGDAARARGAEEFFKTWTASTSRYRRARAVHAWKLRCEGLSFAQIARRFPPERETKSGHIARQTAREMSYKGQRLAEREYADGRPT